MVEMAFLFIGLSHYLACGFIFIGRREMGMGRRFDGGSMYENAIQRDYLNLPPLSTMSPWDEYCNIIYLAAGTMGAVIYGDILPLTTAERLFSILAMSLCRLFIALMYAQAAQYLSEIHSFYSTYVLKLNRITKWMRLNNFP
jgi:potassium voltage-gated channel Eag-related subfamily H member 8